jgi:hypothetical protein
VGAVVGGATVGAAGHLANRHSKSRLRGVRIPNGVNPKRLDVTRLIRGLDANELVSHLDVKRLSKNIDLKDLIRQLGNIAEQVETRSGEVHALSGQAKRLSRRMG